MQSPIPAKNAKIVAKIGGAITLPGTAMVAKVPTAMHVQEAHAPMMMMGMADQIATAIEMAVLGPLMIAENRADTPACLWDQDKAGAPTHHRRQGQDLQKSRISANLVAAIKNLTIDMSQKVTTTILSSHILRL